ncbi:hypothetical protein MUY14_09650 [Amycolatopsis sp. FBCC-B4732]|uniref:hypothetical protein n=1 Tax=Amycolatopsis sp. FBCC-B4732 TaxID=3079339 RepID=UPI001FF25E05|nr:hypothetical protein [Amycolatopsis sp. FBCC-B4732]UOX90868.1 hypothetical protein MUY14_09650 [Amycolatopsis sp. FBCC-B4732]
MGEAGGTEPGTDRSWPARHGGGYPRGWQVRYRGRRPGRGSPPPPELIGIIAGPSLRDEHTSTTWVPVRPYRAAPDTPLKLVRAADILDARPPGGGPAPAAADEDRERVEPPGTDPGAGPAG